MSDDTPASSVYADDSEVWFSPTPGTYVVIRINAVEMVRHLNDADALEAAKQMQTKSHLICLDREMDLPFPDKPWYRFEAQPIGPHLPPANPAKHYTPEMCIPIFPNTRHPAGRAPVHPERPFPYTSCCHWIDTEADAVRISGKTQVLMSYVFTPDYLRAMADADADAERARKEALEAAQAARHQARRQAESVPLSSMNASGVSERCKEYAGHAPEGDLSGDAASVSSHWSRSARGPMSSVEDIMRMDIFTGPDEDLALVPLVDLWPDLSANLEEEDIPSPLELYKEIETIQGIIQQARIRAYTALTAQGPQEAREHVSSTPRSTSIDLNLGLMAALRFWFGSLGCYGLIPVCAA
ncbi:hypothetical protein TRAPUB_2638 [Trametes pubescens]|uniref:Uncharacterized protein n=1 Tax=Trametes pubescens TaxID=154538 RepID=A0A1M2VG25_TRAPU|nr:hypothetical protein TRAPUB_2638 [Trametes pubescens]